MTPALLRRFGHRDHRLRQEAAASRGAGTRVVVGPHRAVAPRMQAGEDRRHRRHRPRRLPHGHVEDQAARGEVVECRARARPGAVDAELIRTQACRPAAAARSVRRWRAGARRARASPAARDSSRACRRASDRDARPASRARRPRSAPPTRCRSTDPSNQQRSSRRVAGLTTRANACSPSTVTRKSDPPRSGWRCLSPSTPTLKRSTPSAGTSRWRRTAVPGGVARASRVAPQPAV